MAEPAAPTPNPTPVKPDYAAMSDAELEAAMKAETERLLTPPGKETEPPTPEPPVAEAVEAKTEEPKKEPEPEPPQEEPDAWQLLAAQAEAREKRLEADLELQRAHASRLAGQIGNLQRQLKERAASPQEAEPLDERPEPPPDVYARLAALELGQKQSEAAAAIEEQVALGRRLLPPDVTNEEIAACEGAYGDAWSAVLQEDDPETASRMTRAIISGIAARVEESRIAKLTQARLEVQKTQRADAIKRKKEAAISDSGSSVGATLRPKSYEDMSVEELDKELTKLYGRR